MRVLFGVVFVLAVSASATAQSSVPPRLSLAEALRLAEAGNPELRAVRADTDVAAADRLTAALRPNPALSVDSEGYPLFQSSRPAFFSGQTLSFRLDQEIETGGRRGLRIEAADAGRAAAEARYTDAKRQLALAVQRAYWQTALAAADRQTATNVLADIDRTIELSRARATSGEIAGAEVRRLSLERLKFVEDLFAANLALKNSRAALLTLIGASDLSLDVDPLDGLTSVVTVIGDGGTALVPVDPTAALDLPSLRTYALTRRPDVASVERDVQRLDTETRLQRALRSPNITVGGGYERDLGKSAVIFGATIPLPVANRNQGQIARATAERGQATARLEATRNQVALDVQQAVNAVSTNRERIRYLETEYLGNALSARDTALASYRLGAADLLEYLDAQRVYRDTLRTYNRALFDAKVSLSELAAAIGGVVSSTSLR